MKLLLVLLLSISSLLAEECYFNKVKNVCYYKYFKKSNIYQSKADEQYYITKNGRIYTFDNIIEVKFNSIGAIFTILNDLELEFVDKIRKEVYLFRVEDRNELFSVISKLNRLKTVMKAGPHKKRKYTKSHIEAQKAARKARLNAVIKKAQNNISNKNNKSSTQEKRNVGFNVPESNDNPKEKRSFLKGNAH